MSAQIFTMKSCKHLSGEITIDTNDILFIEKMRNGNARLHFNGHDTITVLEPYAHAVALKYPPSPSLAFTGADRRTAERRTESLEALPIAPTDGDDKDFERVPAHDTPHRPRHDHHAELVNHGKNKKK